MDTEKMFELADRLRALRDEKAEAEQHLKEIKAEMDEVDYRLSELMAESETQNFTRAGTMFCLTTKTHASAVAGRKEELFSTLRAGGFGDLVYETVNANSLSAFVKEQVAENGDITMYGYRQVNGRLEVVPEEAEIIRLAADLYLEGYGRYKLEDAFATVNIKGRHGANMGGNSIVDLICNEKIVGDICCKDFVVDPSQRGSQEQRRKTAVFCRGQP